MGRGEKRLFHAIKQERDFAYAGYAGIEEFARQLARTLESPIWPAVRRPARWAAPAGADAAPDLAKIA